MRPLRHDNAFEVTHNPISGQDRILESTEKTDLLSDDGSIDSSGVHRKYFRDCGCDGPVGGCCYQCQAISCTACHGRCQNCQMPICLQHSHFWETDKQGIIRLCTHCFDSLTRKYKWSKVGNLLLSLFVEKADE